MHQENTKTTQKVDWDELFTNWYKLLLCGPTLMGLILGIVIQLYIKGETTNRFEKGIIGPAIGAGAGLVTGGILTLAIGLGIAFFNDPERKWVSTPTDTTHESHIINLTPAVSQP